MYSGYFGFSDAPFSIAPDPRFLYLSAYHREALAHLLYGVEQGGFVVLTGEVGTGKTTVCRCLLQQLPAHVDVAFIINPRQSVIELLQSILAELGIELGSDITSSKVLVDLLNERLLEGHAQGRNTILIIDEAQNLAADVLEQLRLLTNLETSQRKLLQLILLGQPELNALLDSQQLRQLAQRVTARYHLAALGPADVGEYVLHRLGIAGFRGELFTRPALRRVARLSGGIPRLINLICDRALLGVYSSSGKQVDHAVVGRAAAEVLPRAGSPRRRYWTAAVALCGVLVASWLYLQIPAPPGWPTAPSHAWLASADAVDPPAGPAIGDVVAADSIPPAPDTVTSAASAGAGRGKAIDGRNDTGQIADPVAGSDPTASPAGAAASDDGETGGTLEASLALLANLWRIEMPPGTNCPAQVAGRLWCDQTTLSIERLRTIAIPAVLELAGQRYVVVERMSDAGVEIRSNPARTSQLSMDDLGRLWEGRAWLITPLDPALADQLPLAAGAILPTALEDLAERLPEWSGVQHYPGFQHSVLTDQRPEQGLAGALFERFDVIVRDGSARQLTPALSGLLRDYQRQAGMTPTGQLDPLTALRLSVALRPDSPTIHPADRH